jgi:hypothetical protein
MLDSLFQKNRPRSPQARRSARDPYEKIDARVKLSPTRTKARSQKELQKRIEEQERELYTARAEKRRRQKDAENIIPAPTSRTRRPNENGPERMTKHQAALVRRDNVQQAALCIFLCGLIVAMAVAIYRVFHS